MVRRQRLRRWLAVGAGVAVLAALPSIVRALPAGAAPVAPDTLVARIAASARQPYQGYAVATCHAGLPSLPQLGDLTGLFDGDTSLRIFYASPGRWRVDTIGVADERDIYHSATQETVWDYGQNQQITIVGTVQVRLPRGGDLAPPDLARRALAAARPAKPGGAPGATYSALPTRRLAGIGAAGVRLTPTDPATTVAHIDIWADPATGLPLEVVVYARGLATPVLDSRILDVTLAAPPDGVTTPPAVPPGVGATVTDNPDIGRALSNLGLGALPDRLDGAARTDSGLGALPGIGAYGTGFRQIVAVSLPGRTGFAAYRAAQNVSTGIGESYAYGRAVIVSTPLVCVMVVQAFGSRSTYIVAGMVGSDVLLNAGADLTDWIGPPR